MGIIGNLMAAFAVRGYNRHHYHLGSRLFDFVPDSVNLVICGGRNGSYLSDGSYKCTNADEIKAEVFYSSCEELKNRSYGAVALYDSLHIPTVSIDQLEIDREKILEFGRDISYTPLNSSLVGKDGIQHVYDFFERIILTYCKRAKRESTILLDCIKMVIDLIYVSLGGDYLTYTNIDKIIRELMNKGQLDFEDYIKHQLHIGLDSEWADFLTLSWDEIRKNLIPFWKEFEGAISSRKVIGSSTESLLSGLSKGKLCIIDSRSKMDMFIDIVLSELVLVNEFNIKYGLIDYFVELKGIQEYRYDEGRICRFIGNSYSSLGISQVNLLNPVCVCLGVNASDARDIIKQMVSNGSLVETNMGFASRGSHVGFTNNVRGVITEDMLSALRIPDGSAFRLDSNGFTLIHNLLG